jgi:hypothetical protein
VNVYEALDRALGGPGLSGDILRALRADGFDVVLVEPRSGSEGTATADEPPRTSWAHTPFGRWKDDLYPIGERFAPVAATADEPPRVTNPSVSDGIESIRYEHPDWVIVTYSDGDEWSVPRAPWPAPVPGTHESDLPGVYGPWIDHAHAPGSAVGWDACRRWSRGSRSNRKEPPQ